MPVLAGYQSAVSAAGTSTAFAAAPTTVLDPPNNTQYQISAAAKEVWDPAVAPTVLKNGVAQPANAYTINYLFGIITFNAGLLSTDVVTVSGNYFPIAPLLVAKEFSASFKRDMLDTTVFQQPNAAKSYLPGLKTVTGSISHLDTSLGQYSGTNSIWTMFDAATGLVIDFQPGFGNRFRSWVQLPQLDEKAQTTGLVEGTLNWQGIPAPTIPTTGNQPTYAWGSP